METTEKLLALNSQLLEIDDLRQDSNSSFSSQHARWSVDTVRCIGSIFGEDHEYLKKFKSISYSPGAITLNDNLQQKLDYVCYLRGLEASRNLLSEMIDHLSETSQEVNLPDKSDYQQILDNRYLSTKGQAVKTIPTRVYVSVPGDHGLQPDQLAMKRALLNLIKSVGFEPQEFGAPGDLSQTAWNFQNVQSVLGRCQGAVILGLIRWDVRDSQNAYRFNTPYNHYEGALALAADIPTFILMHQDVYQGGIAYRGGGQQIVILPDMVNPSWLQTNDFLSRYFKWVSLVRNRRHVFLGYSSKAKSTAILVRDSLTQMGVLVMDWAVDFNPAHTIMGEIEQAAKSCLGGIFLFTKDDEIIVGDAIAASPRDNVIFEAGYFMHAKGIGKTLIIREEGTKMPADIGGQIYLLIRDRNDISPIEKDLRRFVTNNL